MTLTKQQIEWLESLARMEIRGKERGLAKAAPKYDQTPEEFARIKAHLEERLVFMRETLTALRIEKSSGQFPSALEGIKSD